MSETTTKGTFTQANNNAGKWGGLSPLTGAILFLMLIVGLGGALAVSRDIRMNAAKVWEDQADAETDRLTTTIGRWIEASETPVHAIATLFQGSGDVGEDEFWDGILLVEENQPDFFPSSLAVVTPSDNGEAVTWPVLYSVTESSRLATGYDVAKDAELAPAIATALDNPGQARIGSAFRDEQGTAWIAHALAVEASGGTYVIIGLTDLSEIVDGLFETRAPQGLSLRLLAEAVPGQSETASVIFGDDQPPDDTLVTKTIRGLVFGASFTFLWDVSPEFQGGKTSRRADIVLLSGILVTLLVTVFVFFVFRQNQQVKRAVRDRTAELRLALDNMPGGMFMVDKDNKFRVFNKSYSELYGLPDEAIENGGSLDDLVRARAIRGDYGPGDTETLVEKRLENFGKGKSERFTEQLPSGRIVEFMRSQTADGGAVAVATDVTERVKSSETAKRLREAIDGFSDSIILYDKDERVVFSNDKYHELYPNAPAKAEIAGCTQEQLLRRSLEDGRIDDPVALSDPESWIASRLAERRENRFHSAETTHKSGRVLMIRHRPTSDGGLIVAHTDITERKQAEADLAEKETQLRLAMDYMPGALFVVDENFKLALVNDRYTELYGHPDNMVVEGASMEDILRYELQHGILTEAGDPEEILAERLASFQSSEASSFEDLTPTGRYIQISRQPAPGSKVVTVMTDITEKKLNEAAVKASERQLRQMLEDSPIAVAISVDDQSDDDGIIEFANRRFTEMVGIGPEAVGEARTEQFMPKEEREPVHEGTPGEGVSLMDMEIQVRRTDGSHLWALKSLSSIQYGDRQSTLIWLYDITDRKQVEERIRDAERQLAAILEHSPIGVATRRKKDGSIAYANPRIGEIFGMSVDEYSATPIEAFYPDHDDYKRIENVISDGGEIFGREVLQKRKNGESFWASISLVSIEHSHDFDHVAWIEDISVRKEAEEALRVAKAQAETALEDLKKTQARLVTTEKMASLGQLTAGIAHEIKNPLNFVNNFAETSVELVSELEEALEPVKGRIDAETLDEIEDIAGLLKEDLTKIAGHGKRADGIVKSMLMHARGAADGHRSVDVNEMVKEAMGLAYHGERARDTMFKSGYDIVTDPDTGSITTSVEDTVRVLVNIITNAFHAVSERSRLGQDGYDPKVVVSTAGNDDTVLIRICDNGTGMPEEVRSQIFEPFFTTKPTGEGTGLGLSMSYDIIVQQNGGQLEVESEAGEFTEFRITLPRTPRERPEQKAKRQ